MTLWYSNFSRNNNNYYFSLSWVATVHLTNSSFLKYQSFQGYDESLRPRAWLASCLSKCEITLEIIIVWSTKPRSTGKVFLLLIFPVWPREVQVIHMEWVALTSKFLVHFSCQCEVNKIAGFYSRETRKALQQQFLFFTSLVDLH